MNDKINEIEESFAKQKTKYISVKREHVLYLIEQAKENEYYKDVIADVVSVGEMQGENFLLEPWHSLKDAYDKFTK